MLRHRSDMRSSFSGPQVRRLTGKLRLVPEKAAVLRHVEIYREVETERGSVGWFMDERSRYGRLVGGLPGFIIGTADHDVVVFEQRALLPFEVDQADVVIDQRL